LFDVVNKGFDLYGGNRPILASLCYAVYYLGFVEGFSSSVFLNNQEGKAFELFVGSETFAAFNAFAAAADTGSVVCGAGVDNFTVKVAAKGTFHNSCPPCCVYFVCVVWVGEHIPPHIVLYL
jgi:hypothetical protein